jgi:putative transposase
VVLQPLLPVHVNTHRFEGGRPRASDRDCVDAIFYVPLERDANCKRWIKPSCVRTQAAHDRFQEWVQAGLFLKLWQAGTEQFEELCGIDWDWLSMDGAMRHLPALWRGKKPAPIRPTEASAG